VDINILDVYRSSNIGVFLKCNEKAILIPKGLAPTKADKLSSSVKVPCVHTSIDGLRLIGPLTAMNSSGILVSRYIEEDELKSLKTETGMNVERFPSNYNAIGNLIAVNDFGGIASNLLSTTHVKLIQDVLGVPVERMNVAGYLTVGSFIFCTNAGTLVHPLTPEKEIQEIKSILKTDVIPCTINNGVPFISSGILGNSKGIIVGSLTNGTELLNLSAIFK
jgi:translation initiation factor 6